MTNKKFTYVKTEKIADAKSYDLKIGMFATSGTVIQEWTRKLTYENPCKDSTIAVAAWKDKDNKDIADPSFDYTLWTAGTEIDAGKMITTPTYAFCRA